MDNRAKLKPFYTLERVTITAVAIGHGDLCLPPADRGVVPLGFYETPWRYQIHIIFQKNGGGGWTKSFHAVLLIFEMFPPRLKGWPCENLCMLFSDTFIHLSVPSLIGFSWAYHKANIKINFIARPMVIIAILKFEQARDRALRIRNIRQQAVKHMVS